MFKSSKGKGPAVGNKPSKKLSPTTPGKTTQQKAPKPKDPVEVYCRLRPLKEEEAQSCANVISESVLQLNPPECSHDFKSGHKNPTQHTFKHVFDEESNQTDLFDSLGFPFVEDLLQGKDGLLFAYGITNSGKTYTMTGEPDQAGVLPRSLDVIFNSITDVQASKYAFRPDGSNGYNIFTEAEARLEQQRTRPKKISPRMRTELPEFGDLLRIPEPRTVERGVDEDSCYAVFVSYVEIYNNFIYDLLEEQPANTVNPKPPQSKIMREDHNRNMYVSGVTEVEVKSTEEAFEVLYQGQKLRRVAQTQLNTESSRSHSVFTIRVVMAPLDHNGEDIIQDKSRVMVSQLSLVDLAGSERTSRTHSQGERLREAGNINNSLMVLRNCMEALRDNQSKNNTRLVPYRDSKLTLLFKNTFDGEGKVRMVVCVSPHTEDYDESIHVMKFAEVTQEVVVDRPQMVRVDSGLAPGRRRANLLYKAALQEVVSSEDGEGESLGFHPVAPHPFSLALGVIAVQKYLSEEGEAFKLAELQSLLEHRNTTRTQLIEDLKKKQVSFREQLVAQETELSQLRAAVKELKQAKASREKTSKEVASLKSLVSSQDEQIAQLNSELERGRLTGSTRDRELGKVKGELAAIARQKDFLARTTEMYEADKRELEMELQSERKEVQQTQADKENYKKKLKGFVTHEREKYERLATQMKHREKDLAVKNAKLRQVTDLIRNSPCASSSAAAPRTPFKSTTTTTNAGGSRTPGPGRVGVREEGGGGGGGVNLPLKGKNRKRSLSESAWLAHKPSSTVESGDLLQPVLKKKKTVSIPRPRDLRSRDVDRYCLQHQEEDSEGDVKTELYKGEIMRTRGGGTSVHFTDVEVLKHSRPKTPVIRHSTRLATKTAPSGSTSAGGRRLHPHVRAQTSDSSLSLTSETSSLSDESQTDVETRCTVAIEGRPGGAQPAHTHTRLTRVGSK